jgi:hypothetical protein
MGRLCGDLRDRFSGPFGLWGRMLSLAAISVALSPHPKIPFLTDQAQRRACRFHRPFLADKAQRLTSGAYALGASGPVPVNLLRIDGHL